MEKTVLTVFGEHESEKIIEKSRFLTYSEHVESEEEAKAMLRLLSGKCSYRETHNACHDALDELAIIRLLGHPLRNYIPLP